MKSNRLVPELSVSDFKRSIVFYTKTLGFKVEYSREEPRFAFLCREGSQIMIEEFHGTWETAPREHPLGRGMNLQMEASSIMPLVKALKRKRYPLFREPETHWYKKGNSLLGCEEFLVMDPDGYLLRFSQSIGRTKTAGRSSKQ